MRNIFNVLLPQFGGGDINYFDINVSNSENNIAFSFENQIRTLQYYINSPSVHEPEFEIFRYFEGCGGLVCDIGANKGMSAISISKVNSTMSIISFEPNICLEPSLSYCKLFFLSENVPSRFDYAMIGFGSERKLLDFYIPVVDGQYVTTEASFSRENFEKDWVKCRIEGYSRNKRFDLLPVKLNIIPFDELSLLPEIVKIDTEGFEFEVISGMKSTIEKCKPMFFLENSGIDRLNSVLDPHGYRPYIFDITTKKIFECSGNDNPVNIIYLAKDRLDFYKTILPLGCGS